MGHSELTRDMVDGMDDMGAVCDMPREDLSDTLRRMKSRADGDYRLIDKLYPWASIDARTEEENETLTIVSQALDQLRVSLALLAEFAEERENPPQPWGREP